jgi:hypothetical protein
MNMKQQVNFIFIRHGNSCGNLTNSLKSKIGNIIDNDRHISRDKAEKEIYKLFKDYVVLIDWILKIFIK